MAVAEDEEQGAGRMVQGSCGRPRRQKRWFGRLCRVGMSLRAAMGRDEARAEIWCDVWCGEMRIERDGCGSGPR